MMPDLDLALDVARRAVEAACAASLRHHGRGVAVEWKADDSPVTAADRESEEAILDVIRRAFPDHAVLGEETGARGASASRWIVDPLDGTRGFTRGEGCWGPLVGLEHDGEVVAGAMALPVAREVFFAARGRGCWCATGAAAPVRLAVSTVARWPQATFSLGEPRVLLAPPFLEPVARLATSCARTRCHGDLAGFAMVLRGQAEAWVEAGVKIWDLAPMKVLVEEAGGTFTDLRGRATIASGHALASNGRVHDEVLAALAPAVAA